MLRQLFLLITAMLCTASAFPENLLPIKHDPIREKSVSVETKSNLPITEDLDTEETAWSVVGWGGGHGHHGGGHGHYGGGFGHYGGGYGHYGGGHGHHHHHGR